MRRLTHLEKGLSFQAPKSGLNLRSLCLKDPEGLNTLRALDSLDTSEMLNELETLETSDILATGSDNFFPLPKDSEPPPNIYCPQLPNLSSRHGVSPLLPQQLSHPTALPLLVLVRHLGAAQTIQLQ